MVAVSKIRNRQGQKSRLRKDDGSFISDTLA